MDATSRRQFRLPIDEAAATSIGAVPTRSIRRSQHRAVHRSGYERQGRDFYATPDWVTEALLRHVPLRGPVWEPCCGTGAMSSVLSRHGHAVYSSDIADRGFGVAGINFLRCREVPADCRSIVTNPPYGDTGSHVGQTKSSAAMLDFLRHALAMTASVQGQLALLVRLQWTAGKRAAEVMSAAPFMCLIVLTRRIQWFDMGERTNTAQHHHAWAVFDYANLERIPPILLFD